MVSKNAKHLRYHTIPKTMCENCITSGALIRIERLPYDTVAADRKEPLYVCQSCMDGLMDVWTELGEAFDVPMVRLDNHERVTLCCLPDNKAKVAFELPSE